MTNNSNEKKRKRGFGDLTSFLSKISWIQTIISALLFTLVMLGFLLFLIAFESSETGGDQTRVQNYLLMTLMIFGSYGYLLNMLLKPDQRRKIVALHLGLILLGAAIAFISFFGKQFPIESVDFWNKFLVELFFYFFSLSLILFVLIEFLGTAPSNKSNKPDENDSGEFFEG